MLHGFTLDPDTWEEEAWCCDEEGCECCEEDSGLPDDWTGIDHKDDALVQHAAAPGSSTSTEEEMPQYPSNPTSRTLYHPSFEAYYEAVAMHHKSGNREIREVREGGFNINNGDYYYTDPLLSAGHRVYNCLSTDTQNIFHCFHLNTPPPIMSSRVYTSPTAHCATFMPQDSLTNFPSHHEASPQSNLTVVDNQWATLSERMKNQETPVRPSYLMREEKTNEVICSIQSPSEAPCTPAEADAVCALLSLSVTCPLPAGQ